MAPGAGCREPGAESLVLGAWRLNGLELGVGRRDSAVLAPRTKIYGAECCEHALLLAIFGRLWYGAITYGGA